MRSAHQGNVFHQLQRVFGGGATGGLSEDELLGRFRERRDEASLEALIERHGPMVWGVCRRVLRNSDDAADAFQATFLILLRKAGTLRDPAGVSAWLYGVACRVALRARADAARRGEKELRAARPEAVEVEVEPDCDLLSLVLDEEIQRLPEKYLRPFVLCCLEGLSYEEASRRLNRTPASVKGRLARARERLRTQLTRRGVAPAPGVVISELLSKPPAVPQAVARSTVELLRSALAGGSVATMAGAGTVAALANGVSSTVEISPLKIAAAALLSAIAVCTLVVLIGPLMGVTADEKAPAVGRPQGAAHPDQKKPQPLPDEPRERPGGSLEITVVDKRTGKALPGVALKVAADASRKKVTTDASGQYLFAMPERPPSALWLLASKEGFVPTYVQWGGVNDSVRASMPTSYRFALEAGTTIGGVVQDPDGRPIAGTLVYLSIARGADLDGGNAEPSLETSPVKTDAKGRWIFKEAPANLDGLSYRLEHPDYICEASFDRGPWASALRNLTAVMVMERGVTVLGRVTDREGRPISGAIVAKVISDSGNTSSPTVTDPDGNFSLSHAKPGESALIVRAAGHAPEFKKVRVTDGMRPVEFRLGPGHTVRGRVVDSGGKPVADAFVGIIEWNEYKLVRWLWTKSAADGGFHLSDAPAEPATLRASKPGYLVNLVQRPTTEGEHRITLLPELTIRGAVTDAQTGQSIDDFTVLIGDGSKEEPLRWDRIQSYHRRNGHFEAVFSNPEPETRRLRIEADGYFPTVSRKFQRTEGLQAYDVRLTPHASPIDPALSGIVLLPEGSPAAGAVVSLATKSQPVTVKEGWDVETRRHPTMTTGADGRFAFPRQEEPAIIIAHHEQGHAQLLGEELGASHVIKLQPWSRVVGTLKIGAERGAFQVVSLSHEPTPKDELHPRLREERAESETDGAGRFVFEKVLPGKGQIRRQFPMRGDFTGSGPLTPFDVAPGGTAHVTLGGLGRPVVGRFLANEDLKRSVDWTAPTVMIFVHLQFPRVAVPEGLTGSKRTDWAKAWRQTDLGKAYAKDRERALFATYSAEIARDGSFRIEDVAAGTYEWTVLPRLPVPKGQAFWSVTPTTFVVPEIPEQRTDQPLEIGAFELSAHDSPVR